MRRILSVGFQRFASAFVVFSVVAANAQMQKPSSTVASVMQMPIVAPLFIEDGDFTSNLVLVNGSGVSTFADVALRSFDGRTVATQRVNFRPYSQRQLNISDLLQAGTAPNLTNGSVTVMQSPSLSGMVIVAALSITQRSSPTPHYIDEELAMPSTASSQMLRGVADSSNGSLLVAITSLSDMPQHVTISCLGGVRGSTSTVTLAPSQTLLTPVCGHDQDSIQGADFHWYAENVSHGLREPVGIALMSDGMPGSFAAFGLAPHDSKGGQYFSSVAFNDPMMLQSTITEFTGVPVGFSPLLPNTLNTPVLTLANFSKGTRHVTVQYALTENGSASAKTVTTMDLAPSSSQQIPLRGLKGDPMLQDSVIVASDGSPGDVGLKLASTSDSPLFEVELLGKDFADHDNGGDHPWTIENGTKSTLILFNDTAKSQYVNVEIAAGGTVWRKVYQLQPMQTEAITINDLIETAAKDDAGKVFPSDIWSGQVAWYTPAKNAGRGRLLQSNPETDMARNFSCGYVAELCQVSYDGGTSTVIGSGTSAQMDTQVCMNNCYGTPAGPGGGDYEYQWSSEEPSIADIPSPELISQVVNINGYDAGVAYIDGWASDGYCTQSFPSQSVSVAPVITGTPKQGGSSHDIWYFGSGISSQSAGATQFTYSISLTASGSGTPTWNVTAGSSEVTLTPQAGTNTAIVASSGTAWSSQNLDVSITATVNGQTSSAYQLTTHVPYVMSFDSDNHQCSSTNGYIDTISYNVADQLGNSLSSYLFDFNENFTTGFTDVNGSNWGPPTTGNATGAQVQDTISGVGVNNQPAPVPTPVCSGNDTEAQYATQQWRVGSLTTGAGILLQTDQWTRYADRGSHN